MIAAFAFVPGIMKAITNPYVLIAAAVIGAFLYGRHVEHDIGEAATLRAELAIAKSDLGISKSAEELAKAQGAQLAEDLSSKEREIDALEIELAAGSDGDKYRATDGDIKRVFGGRR